MDNYLDCTKAFAETMRDQYIAPGDKTNRLISMASAIATEYWFKHLVKASMSLAELSKMDNIKDIIKKFYHDTD